MKVALVLPLAAFLASTSRAYAATDDTWRFGDSKACVVMRPPASLHLDAFYEKYCSAGGVPIVAAAVVPDAAVQQVARIVGSLLAPLPAVRRAMIRQHLRVMVLGANQRTTDLPEERGEPDSLNTRARGLFNPSPVPNAFAAEENVLCYERDGWRGESILIHEFGHALAISGFDVVDRGFRQRLQSAFDSATADGKYAGRYAGTNPEEYWAEGLQDYFDVHQRRDPTDINTREDLAKYDPTLYSILDEKFHAVRLPPACPRPEFHKQSWYRLRSAAPGSSGALDDASLGAAARVSGQFWHLSDNRDGTFRLSNLFRGGGQALDVANDGVYEPVMAATGNYSGQHWKLTPITTGFYRLVSAFQPAKSLAANDATLALEPSEDAAAQAWTIETVR